MAQKEHDELSEQVRRIFEVRDDDSVMVTDGPNPQFQTNLNVIMQLYEEVEAVKTEAEEWKKNMDRLASEKESTWAQLTSTKSFEV